MTYFSYINNVKNFLMKTNNKLNNANDYRLSQEILRNKALAKGVNLIAPQTIFLSEDTAFAGDRGLGNMEYVGIINSSILKL